MSRSLRDTHRTIGKRLAEKEPTEKGPEKDTLQKTGKTEANRIL